MSAFWSLRGHHTEGRQRLDELLSLVPGESIDRVSALNGAAWLAIDQGDYARAADLLGREHRAQPSRWATRWVRASRPCTSAAARCPACASWRPHRKWSAAVALMHEAGDRPAIAFSMFYSGLVALLTGRLEAACDLFGRCAALAAELGLAPLGARARQMLGFPLLDLGELAAARAAMAESFPEIMDVGDRWVIQIGLSGFIGLAAKTGRPRLALRLAGAADAYRDVNEFSLPEPIAEMVDRWLAPRARQGRAGGRPAARGRPAAEPGGGGWSRPGERAGRTWAAECLAAGPAAGLIFGADPPGGRGRGAGGTRADQPGHRRAALPLGADRRGARRPHPDQAGVPHPDPAGRLGPGGRPAARRYVAAT